MENKTSTKENDLALLFIILNTLEGKENVAIFELTQINISENVLRV